MISPAIALRFVLPLVLPFVLVAGATAQVAGLPAVSVVTAAGVDCPAAAAIERALAGVRGRDAPPPSDAGDAWALSVARVGAELQVSLRDPAGADVLSRVLGVSSSGCDGAAQAIAIVVERYFRDLAWTPNAPARAERPVSSSPPPSSSSAAAAAVQPTIVANADDDEVRRRFFADPPRFALGAGPALWTRMGGPAALLDARVRVAGPIVVRAGALLPPFRTNQTLPTEIGQSPAVARTWGLPFLAGVAVGGTRGRFGGSVGVEALLTFEEGESQGIAVPASELRTVFAAGLGLGGSVALGPRFRIAADVAGYRAALGRSFEVGGLANPVLEPPKWQAIFGLRLEWVVLP